MAKDEEKDPLTRWRRAESDYAEAIAPFLKGEPRKMSKDTQVSLARMRAKADRCRDRYFKKS